MITMDVQFEEIESHFSATFNEDDTFDVSFGQIDGTTSEEYDGQYEFTPSNDVQVLNTADKHLVDNIKINPIPQNYGLITWDGSTITVS